MFIFKHCVLGKKSTLHHHEIFDGQLLTLSVLAKDLSSSRIQRSVALYLLTDAKIRRVAAWAGVGQLRGGERGRAVTQRGQVARPGQLWLGMTWTLAHKLMWTKSMNPPSHNHSLPIFKNRAPCFEQWQSSKNSRSQFTSQLQL